MKTWRVLTAALTGAVLALMFAGCAISEEQKEEQASRGESSQQGAPITQLKPEKPYQNATLKFDKGNPGLTVKDTDKLTKLAGQMREEGNVKRAKVVVWPDKDPHKDKVSKADRDLAAKRASNIEKYLSQEGITQVQAFNMADNKNWLAKNLNRSEKELSATFAKKGEAPVTQKEFKTIKSDGGPSKAVVILERQQSQSQ